MLLKCFKLWIMLALIAQTVQGSPGDFYRSLLIRGASDYEFGNYGNAERELRIAAFGFLDDVPAYQTAQVYQTLVQLRLGQKGEAAKILSLLLHAEKVSPGYQNLSLPATVRSAFEKEVPSLLTPEQVATFPDLFPTTAVVSKTASVDELKNLELMAKKNPGSIPIRAALAEAKFGVGDYRAARKLAESVLTAEPGNSTALSVLGRIAAHDGRYADVVLRLSAVESARALGDDENAALFVALVETADLAAAQRLALTLSAAVRSRPDVTRAFSKMESARPQVVEEPSPEAPKNLVLPPPPQARPDEGRVTAASLEAAAPPLEPAASIENGAVMTAARTPESVASLLAEANRAWAGGMNARATSIFNRLAARTDLDRSTLLTVAMGMAQTGAFAESIEVYRRAGRLRIGEELHLFYKAVNYFHSGDFHLAREYLKLALPKISMTAEVADYKVRIEATP